MINPNLPAGFIGKQFDQIAFIVEDLDTAQQTFRDLYGLDNWSVWENLADGQERKTYRGEPEDFGFSCAYSFTGDVLVELCRHDRGRSLYKDWLDARGPSLHHIGFRVRDDAEYEAAIDLFAKQGVEHAMGGELAGAGRWGYFDTTAQTGIFTELYWSGSGTDDLFDRMKRGEVVDLAELRQQ